MNDTMTWDLIHEARRSTATMLAGLTPDQWAAPSLCGSWTVQMTAGHILQAAEQSTGSFMKGMAVNGLRFNAMMDKEARRLGTVPTAEIVERLEARTTTTNRPPAPVMAMLGEVVVHTEDIRQPLGLASAPNPDAVRALLDMYKTSSFPVPGKKRVAGLRVSAPDVGWSHGDGPEVTGPSLAWLLVMTGRPAGLDRLAGDGLATLRERLSS